MKKISVLALLVILAMVISACAGAGGETTGTEDTGGFGDVTTMPEGGSGLEPTEDLGVSPGLDDTEAPGSGTGGTEGTAIPETGGTSIVGTATSPSSGGAVRTTMPTAGSAVRTPTVAGGAGRTTSASPTSAAGGVGTTVPTSQAGGVGTSVPTTGVEIGDFARLSTLQGFELVDSNGESLGTISDFVISVTESVVDYVVVDRAGGDATLVPWAAMMFDSATNAFTFTGDASRFDDAPEFDSSSVDFSDDVWDQDVLDFWMAGGGAAGTSVPSTGGGTTTPGGSVTSTPVTSSGMGTSVPATGGMTGTPSAAATGTIPGTGAQTGPLAVLYTDLVTADVMTSGPATGAANNVQGTPTVGNGGTQSTPMPGGTSVPSTGGTSVPSTGTGGAVTAGDVVGTVEDVVVNVRSGAVAFVLILADEGMEGVPATGGTSVPGMGTGTSVPSTGAGSGTTVPTAGAGGGSGTSVPSTGDAGQVAEQVIPVPMEFIRITEDNEVVVTVSVDRLQQAPTIDMEALEDPINMGWDAQFNTFWMDGGGTSPTSTP